MVRCPYCDDTFERKGIVEKSVLRVHIENKHPERVVG